MRLPALVSTLALAVALSFGNAASAPAQAPEATAAPAREIHTQLPRTARPLHYRIQMRPDAANLRFAASAEIEFELLEATDRITLNAADLEFDRVRVGQDAAQIDVDTAHQTATIRFGRRLAPGRYRLAADYRGRIYTQAFGLFALDYDTPEGRKRALFTQFQAPDARRFVPSWDEPIFRTPWDLSVAVPAGQSAVGNMPVARTDRQTDGSSLVTFQTTPPMSSYLLFLGVGELDRISQRVGDAEIGIVTRRGVAEQGRFALEQTARVLPWFGDYFGTPYPLPKLDNIAGPGSSQQFAAMENWGAIFSFESYLLLDPAITTEAQRQFTYQVLIHEIAHQWFGDLVTMAWWDDIWLNESFASWITTKATDELMPQWEAPLGRIATRETAMNLDSFAVARPVIREVRDVEEMNQLFDVITYEKGESVITMMEDYVGADEWRAGVRDYVARHRLGNTVTEDLWQAMERSSGRPVSAVANDFTRQQGIPLIRVEATACEGGRTRVTLAQGQFSRDRPGDAPRRWRVPVTAAVAGGETGRTLVEGGTGRLELPGCGTAVVNAGQAGYYRTLYAPMLMPALKQAFATLRPVDQIGILADQWALGLAGYQSAAEALDFVDAIPADANPQLWLRAANVFGNLYGRYPAGSPQRTQVGRYASARLGPVLERLGWSASREERDVAALLRAALIGTLGNTGDTAVIAEAQRRFAANDPSVQAGPLRSVILGIVAARADTATWDRLHEMARTEQAAQVKLQLYRLLGSALDENLARRALALALTDEAGATNSSQIISFVAGNHPELAFDFALQHREQVEALVDAPSRAGFLPSLAGGSADAAMAARLRDYARNMTAAARPAADTAIASIEDRVRVRETRLPDVTRWLAAKGL